MNSKIVPGLFILALLLSSCVTEFKAGLPSNDEQILIVDGNIMEDTTVIFNLSKSFPMDSPYTPPDIFNVNATVTITGSDGYESSPAINLGGGAYSIEVGKLDDNVEYGVKIEYDGNTYQSTLSKPLYTPGIDSLSWAQPKEDGPVAIQVSTHDNDSEEAKFYLWSYVEDWETTAAYNTTIFFNLKDSSFYTDFSAPYYYCWGHAVSNQLLTGSTESLKENRIINKQLYQMDAGEKRLSVLYCVTMNQKAISKSAYDYYQNRIKLNGEMGGLFTPQPSNIDGNISCITDPSKRAIGYVEVIKNVTQKRLFVSSTQISHPRGSANCLLIPQADVDTFIINSDTSYAFYYGLGYRPAGAPATPNPNDVFPSNWSYASCTDCVANGGSKVKPDFWPNDDK